MSALAHKPLGWLYCVQHSRTWCVSGGVLLAHVSLAWLLSVNLLASSLPAGETGKIIMASVVMDVSASPVAKPQAATPKVQPKSQVEPSPVLTQTVLSEAAPIVPPTALIPVVAQAAAGDQGTSTSVLVLPSSDADYLNNPAPAYPRMSRRMGEQGTVVLRVFINIKGQAEKAEIHTSSGYRRLDETGLETVRRWRYVPGKRAGVPEAMWFRVPIRFVLD